MTEDTKTMGIVVTPEFRMVWPNLFEAKPFMRNGKAVGEPKYGMTMLFEPGPELDEFKKIAGKVAKAKFGTIDGVTFPFKKGDAEAEKAAAKGKDGSFYKGLVVVKTSSQFQPQVVDDQSQPIIDHGKIYSGCYGFAEVNFVATEITSDDGVKRYVTAYTNFVMKSRDGDRIAGRTAKDVFKGIKGKEVDFDPSASMDDEIPY